jgi:hypothetical protein
VNLNSAALLHSKDALFGQDLRELKKAHVGAGVEKHRSAGRAEPKKDETSVEIFNLPIKRHIQAVYFFRTRFSFPDWVFRYVISALQ